MTLNLNAVNSIALVVAGAAAFLCPALMSARIPGTSTDGEAKFQSLAVAVPFFYVPSQDDKRRMGPSFQDLMRSMDKFKSDASAFLASMTREHEIAQQAELTLLGTDGDDPAHPLLAGHIRKKIGLIADCFEKDFMTLEELMVPFGITIALPAQEDPTGERHKEQHQSAEDDDETNSNEKRFTRPIHLSIRNEESSYDSAVQIITHIVRDWTACGANIRQSLYSWCIDMLEKHIPKEHRSILVPGSGLGRLAYDMARAGYSVEANEVSVSMAAVAFQFLNGLVRKGVVHPFSFDSLTNEVTSKHRYDAVAFPDIDVSTANRAGLSYSVGDFVDIYSCPRRKAQHGAVVTCFFIDTATNIIEYLATIRHVLLPGGVWINVGPIQWHSNALLRPSGNELRDLIEGLGFDVHLWSIDSEPVNYRHDLDGGGRYTKTEAYLPLRFIATRREGESFPRMRDDTKVAIEDMREVYQGLNDLKNSNDDDDIYPGVKENGVNDPITIEEL